MEVITLNYEIKMLSALDEFGNDVFIEDAIQGKDYFCPSCGEVVHCRAMESDKVREHFYHLDKTNCDGGESSLHKYWKYHLINIGEIIELPKISRVKCLDRWIEYATKDGKYRPDLIIKTSSSKYRFVVLEILNTNRKDVDAYNEIWDTYRYPVYEIDVKRLNRDKSNITSCLKLLYSPEKQKFVMETKQQIKELYKVLDENEHKLGYEQREILLKSLGKVYRIFKNNLNKPIRTNLNIIERDLESTFVHRDIFMNFTLPLKRIVNQLEVYK